MRHWRASGQRANSNCPRWPSGDPLDLKDLEETQHFTQPPPRYSEASLVKKLESLGIGRPSTYASIISTIQERGYVEQKKNLFLRCADHPKCTYTVPCDINGKPMWPVEKHEKISTQCTKSLEPREGTRCMFATNLGEVVTDKLVAHFPDIMDVKFTSHMEDELDGVEDASTQQLAVIREFWGPFSADLKKAGEEMESTKNTPVESAGPCPTCGAPLVQRWSKHGPFLGCSKYPDCKYIRGPTAPANRGPSPSPPSTSARSAAA